jgi:excisionase family DNA binding protein
VSSGSGPFDAFLAELTRRVASILLPHLVDALKADGMAGKAHGTTGEGLIGIHEAASRIGLSVSTVYKRASSGRLPSIKDGSRLLFRPEDLDAYVLERRRSRSRVDSIAKDIRGRSELRVKKGLATAAAAADNVLRNVANDDRSQAPRPGRSALEGRLGRAAAARPDGPGVARGDRSPAHPSGGEAPKAEVKDGMRLQPGHQGEAQLVGEVEGS